MGAICVNGWSLTVGEDREPRVRDIDIGERLGFARPRDFRKLVERMVRDGILNDFDVRATVARQDSATGWGGHRKAVVEYHLSEVAARLAAARSDTAKAIEVTRSMVEAFVSARRDMAPQHLPALPLDVAHGPRVGETEERANLENACRLAALTLKVSIHRIHGAVRRQYGVPSVYALALYAWPFARTFLGSLADGSILLPRARPVLRLIRGGQLVLPQVSP